MSIILIISLSLQDLNFLQFQIDDEKNYVLEKFQVCNWNYKESFHECFWAPFQQ